jgi:hypothetical protein
MEEGIINCFVNKKISDLGNNENCWDWIHENFIKEIFPDKEVSLDEFYDHMIKNSQNYYVVIGVSKSCKCGTCNDGVATFILDENKNAKVFLRDYIKSSKYNLASFYIEEIESFVASKVNNSANSEEK